MLLTLLLSLMLMAGLFLMLFAGVAFIQDKRLFTSAPKDVWQAIKPHPERFRGAHALDWTLAVLAVAIMMGAIVYAGWDGVRCGFTYADFLVRYMIMFLLLETFDVLFFDLFLLTHSRFYQYYYPETEGCAGFHSFGYNWKDHLKTTAACILASLVLSGICVL